MIEELHRTEISGRAKVDKEKSDKALARLNELEGVTAKQITTDEFDLPPTAILKVSVELNELD